MSADLRNESLRLKQQLDAERSRADEARQELELVYDIDERIHGTSRSHAGLAHLVGQSGRFLGIAYSVLLLPAKRIRISATHSTWKNVNRKSLDKYLLDKLFPRLKGHRSPVIFEIPAAPGSTDIADQGYQAMICPLLDPLGSVEGMLAQLGRVDREPFQPSHTRFMSYVVRKVNYVIEQSFDAMTGLMNRAGFETQLEESMKSLADDVVHQVVYFDVDNLHLVNDTFDREAGDEVIARFARILEESLPNNGVASRQTGDDFAVLLAHSSLDDALELAGRVRESCKALRYLESDKSLQITVSAGIAHLGPGSDDGRAALTEARIACDTAKDHGRDRVEVYEPDNKSVVRRFDEMHLIADIQKTLDTDAFELLAQPIASLSGPPGPNRRHEILLRMKDSTGNKISTTSFFSAAERYQLMPQIDRWVVSATMRKLTPHVGVLAEIGATFAINLSGQTLGDDGMLRFIEDQFAASGVHPGTVRFEVTESAAVLNLGKAQALIDALRERGCRFSLDDFGAGLSSFAYLKNFRVDTLKIDGSFIRDITDNRISESMVVAITQVAKVMGLETVAEYVESEKALALVAKLGVDYAQGHAIGKPLPLNEVLEHPGLVKLPG